MYCSDCQFFSDTGRCRNGRARRNDVGYFQNACDLFEPFNQPTKQDTMKEENKALCLPEKPIPEAEAPKTKHCNKCGRDLPLDAFANKKSAKDGKQSLCKECQTASIHASRSRRYGIVTKVENKPAPAPQLPGFDVSGASDKALLQELKRRGYTGTITKTIFVDL